MSRDGGRSFYRAASSDFAVLHLVCAFVPPKTSLERTRGRYNAKPEQQRVPRPARPLGVANAVRSNLAALRRLK